MCINTEGDDRYDVSALSATIDVGAPLLGAASWAHQTHDAVPPFSVLMWNIQKGYML